MIALDVLYPNIHHMYLVEMYISTLIPKNLVEMYIKTVIPKNIYVTHRAPQSVFIIRTSFVVQTIALNKLYPNIHHIQPVLMYIETAIPKNIPAALCRHNPAPHTMRGAPCPQTPIPARRTHFIDAFIAELNKSLTTWPPATVAPTAPVRIPPPPP